MVVVVSARCMSVVRHVARRRIAGHHVFLNDHGRLRVNDVLLDDGRSWARDRNSRSRRSRSLKRRDDTFADALLVKRDDIGNNQLADVTALSNLIVDDLIAQAAARHGNHVLQGNGRLNHGRLLCLSVLIGLGVLLIDLGVLVSSLSTPKFSVFVSGIAKNPSRNRAYDAADRGTGTCFVVMIADQSAGDGSRQTTKGRTALFVGLPVGLSAKSDRENARQRGGGQWVCLDHP